MARVKERRIKLHFDVLIRRLSSRPLHTIECFENSYDAILAALAREALIADYFQGY